MKGWQRNLPLPFCLHIEASIGKPIAEKGYKMKKEYIKPEAEMMKFLEEEEIMSNAPGMAGGTTSYDFADLNLNAL